MGSANAFIMVGKSDPDGLYPTHCLFLYENDKPAWVLTPVLSKEYSKIIWIPTVEHMLEDALLMIGIYVLKDENLVSLAKKFFRNINRDRIWLYDDIEKENLQRLREVCKEIIPKYNVKIIIAITLGSTILRQIGVLKDYKIECEVCITRFRRARDYWSRVLGEFEEYALKNVRWRRFV